jgi:hypothetical protein
MPGAIVRAQLRRQKDVAGNIHTPPVTAYDISQHADDVGKMMIVAGDPVSVVPPSKLHSSAR